jgi:hypothetical protein
MTYLTIVQRKIYQHTMLWGNNYTTVVSPATWRGTKSVCYQPP